MKRKIKILFVNPVIRQEDKPRHIPYGMAQLVAIAKKKKYKIQVFDANAWRPQDSQLRRIFAMDNWDVVAIGGLATTYGYIKRCVQYAKKFCPSALVIAGGGFISAIPYEVMTFMPEIDIGVIGEGVVTFPEVLDKITEGESNYSDVPGTIWRDKGNHLHLPRQRPLLDDLDSLPFPAFDMFPMDIYFRNSSILLSEESMQAKRRIDIMASYGCIYKCKFCFHLGLGGEIKIEDSKVVIDFKSKRRVRAHSPEYVMNLIKYAKKKFNIDFISFIDENFSFLDKIAGDKWLPRFFELWEKENLVPCCIRKKIAHNYKTCKGVHWGATAHVGLVNPALLKGMHDIGCSYLDYGLESFSDKILRSIGKGATSEINERAVRWTVEAGIRPIPNQIIGFPEESFESIKTNISAWKRLGIKSYPFFATPYPGSEWFVQYRDEIIKQYNGNLESFLLDLGNATDITAVISKQFSAVELLGLRELMVNGDIKRISEYEKLYKKRNKISQMEMSEI